MYTYVPQALSIESMEILLWKNIQLVHFTGIIGSIIDFWHDLLETSQNTKLT